jgi:uncharacterized lipoprotein
MKQRSLYLLAATLVATITLAFLASCSYGSRDAAAKRDTAKHAATANVNSPHLPFSNPS